MKNKKHKFEVKFLISLNNDEVKNFDLMTLSISEMIDEYIMKKLKAD